MEKTQLKALVGVSTIIGLLLSAIQCFLAGGVEPSIVSSFIGITMTTAVIVHVAYRKFLWKYDHFQDIPDLSGEREVVLEFEHDTSPNTNRDISAKEDKVYRKKAIVTIKQEERDIVQMKLCTEESVSNIYVGRLIREKENSSYTLYYIFRTKTLSKYRSNNPDRTGACCAYRDETRGYWIGNYWTDELSRGTIHFADMETVIAKTPEHEEQQIEYLS